MAIRQFTRVELARVHDGVRIKYGLESPEDLLSRDLLDQMWTAGLGDYGLGWRVDSVGGHRRLHHDGSTSGFRNYVIRYPDDRLTVLVLTNRRGPDVMPLAERVATLFLAAPGQSS